MKNLYYLIFIMFLTSAIHSQTATLEATLSLEEVNGISIPFQNGIPLPTFEKQNRDMIDLSGTWKKKRFSANHNISLAKRDTDGYTDLINENPNYHLDSFDDSSWEDKDIPSVENMIYDYPTVPEYYEDGVWYRYEFNVEDSLSGSFAKLMFYAVNYVADVWINGEYVGYHEGGYTSFAFDVSNHLNYSEENLIAIRVDNPPWGSRKDIIPFYNCDWFNYTGIIHDIYLEFSDKLSVSRADVIPQNLEGELLTKIAIFNSDSTQKNIDVNLKVFETEITEMNSDSEFSHELASAEANLSGTTTFSLSVNPNSTSVISESIIVNNPKLWSFKDPNLYVLKISLIDSGKVIDEYFTQFGLRTIKRDGNKVLLNENVIFLTGAARHEDHPIYGRSIPKEIIYSDLELIDSSNINYLRTSHYPNNPYTYLIADRLGIGVMEEIPVWWFDNEEEWLIQNNERHIHEQMFREMVFKDYNRPSILFWSTSNECKEETNRIIYNQRVVDDLRNNYDDGRLITQSSAGDNPGHGDLTQGPLDVAGWTLYFGVFHGGFGASYYGGTSVFLIQASSAFPGKPIIDTEFGYWSSEDNSSVQKQIDVFKDTFRAFEFFSSLNKNGSLNSNGFLVGTTWWCVFDWHSHQHPNGFQSMGLVSMDRQTKKPVYETLKNTYEPYYSLGGMVVTDIKNENESMILKEYSLSQNYPNPFNPSTKINFSLPEQSNVKIFLYNSLGQELIKLEDNIMDQGSHSIIIDGAELTSGVYFCKMIANSTRSKKNYNSTIKLLLLK